jgi:hypothetical protein
VTLSTGKYGGLKAIASLSSGAARHHLMTLVRVATVPILFHSALAPVPPPAWRDFYTDIGD